MVEGGGGFAYGAVGECLFEATEEHVELKAGRGVAVAVGALELGAKVSNRGEAARRSLRAMAAVASFMAFV